jgi:putative ABC transport system substrate-binding protein
MTRGIIGLLMTLACGILGAPISSAAPPPGKASRAGVLGAGFPATPPMRLAFLHALRELEWVEGQNLVIERRWATGDDDRLPALVAELVHLPVDVLMTVENSATAAASQAIRTIPIVMVSGGDPVGIGFIASLARPGGNITGTSWPHPEIAGKILAWLTEVVPQARRVAVLTNPALLGVPAYAQTNMAAGRALGVALLAVAVRQPYEGDTALVHLAPERPDALYVVGDPVVAIHQPQLLAFAAQHRFQADEVIR